MPAAARPSTAAARRSPRHDDRGVPSRVLLAVIVIVAASFAGRAAEVVPDTARLSLPDGELVGRLLDAPPGADGASSTLLWQSPHFPAPFEFPLDRVERIRFPPRDDAGQDAAGAWTVHLAGGDQVIGTLVGIDDRHVLVDAAGAGTGQRLTIARDAVRGIGRAGVDGTSEWNGDPEAWNLSAPTDWAGVEAGLRSRRAGARAWRPLPEEPKRVRIDLDLEVRAPEAPAPAPERQQPQRAVVVWPGPRGGRAARGGRLAPAAPMVRVTLGDTLRPQPRGAEVIDHGQGVEEHAEAPYALLLGRFGMVLVRDEKDAVGAGRADLRRAGDLPEGRFALSLFVDRTTGRSVLARSADGEILADLTVEPGAGRAVRALAIEAVAGTVVINGLRVAPWRGVEPGVDTRDAGTVTLRGGQTRAGLVTGLAAGRLAIDPAPEGGGGDPAPILLESVESIEFPLQAPLAASDRATLRVTDRAGNHLSGSLARVADGALWVRHPAIDGELRLSLERLASLAPAGGGGAAAAPAGRPGRMTIDGVTMTGCLESTGSGDTARGVGWRPTGSLLASPLPIGAAAVPARIVYDAAAREAAPTDSIGWLGIEVDPLDGAIVTSLSPDSPAQGSVRSGVRIRAIAPIPGRPFVDTAELSADEIAMLLEGPIGTEVRLRLDVPEAQAASGAPPMLAFPRVPRPGDGPRRSLADLVAVQERLLAGGAAVRPDPGAMAARLILVTGESVACDVASIDERGLSIVVGGGAAVTVPAAAVQAVELVPSSARRISAEKFRSLVTVPRSQRSAPPTHLVRSPRGDYLRGRIVSLDGESLRIAVDAQPRGKPTVIPRSEVARIIWLHPELLSDDWQPPAEEPAAGWVVEGIWPDGARRRLTATAIEGDALVGTHPLLGSSRIDLGTVERLLIGEGLHDAPRARPYAQWTLRPASEPRREPPR